MCYRFSLRIVYRIRWVSIHNYLIIINNFQTILFKLLVVDSLLYTVAGNLSNVKLVEHLSFPSVSEQL